MISERERGWSGETLHIFTEYSYPHTAQGKAYNMCIHMQTQLTLTGINEFARAKKIIWGVQAAAVVYPGSLLAMAIVGMFRGNTSALQLAEYIGAFIPGSKCVAWRFPSIKDGSRSAPCNKTSNCSWNFGCLVILFLLCPAQVVESCG